jgi:hypothetical protein
MQSTKQRRPVKPVAPILRQVILLRPITGNSPGLIQVTASGTTSRYTVRRMASGIGGRAFELAKQNEDPGDGPYHILVDGDHSQCECRGWLRYGSLHPCRHLWAAATLARRGLI